MGSQRVGHDWATEQQQQSLWCSSLKSTVAPAASLLLFCLLWTSWAWNSYCLLCSCKVHKSTAAWRGCRRATTQVRHMDKLSWLDMWTHAHDFEKFETWGFICSGLTVVKTEVGELRMNSSHHNFGLFTSQTHPLPPDFWPMSLLPVSPCTWIACKLIANSTSPRLTGTSTKSSPMGWNLSLIPSSTVLSASLGVSTSCYLCRGEIWAPAWFPLQKESSLRWSVSLVAVHHESPCPVICWWEVLNKEVHAATDRWLL